MASKKTKLSRFKDLSGKTNDLSKISFSSYKPLGCIGGKLGIDLNMKNDIKGKEKSVR